MSIEEILNNQQQEKVDSSFRKICSTPLEIIARDWDRFRLKKEIKKKK
jgi:hypothetical protein